MGKHGLEEAVVEQRKQALKGVERLVVKVGTSLLADPTLADPNSQIRKRVAQVVEQVQTLRMNGKKVIIVTSGAIGMGMVRLGLKSKPKEIPAKQATAAIGQVLLMEEYARAFKAHGVPVGQMLLTRADFENGHRYLNARNTLATLLAQGAVPVINENDSVAVEEIKFGDNDNLAAQVCNLAQAQLLVILTDVEGFYDKDPHKDRSAHLVPLVSKITRTIINSAGGEGSNVGTGGMATKIQAARTVRAKHKMMAIVDGHRKDGLLKLMAFEEIGTLFSANFTRAGNKGPFGQKR
jgi:glutamate 5-kinase